jgi:hypothetical protein
LWESNGRNGGAAGSPKYACRQQLHPSLVTQLRDFIQRAIVFINRAVSNDPRGVTKSKKNKKKKKKMDSVDICPHFRKKKKKVGSAINQGLNLG